MEEEVILQEFNEVQTVSFKSILNVEMPFPLELRGFHDIIFQ